MNSRRVIAPLALITLLVTGLAIAAHGTADDVSRVRVKRARYIMGTIFEITAYGPDRSGTVAAVEEAFAAIREADRVMSHYRDDSELSRLNHLGRDRVLTISGTLDGVLRESVKYWDISGGAFDITIGPLVALWQEGADRGQVPEPSVIKETLKRIGTDAIQRRTTVAGEQRSHMVKFLREGVEVNLGAIGKGWAVDEAVAILRRYGIRDALVNAGTSTLYAMGDDGNEKGWWIELVDPCDRERSLTSIRLADASLSSSAAYERYWEIGGVRYSHILDPRTGYPVEPLRGITVIGGTATETDALSTAAYVLGLEAGGSLLERTGAKGILVASEAGGDCRAYERGRFIGSGNTVSANRGEGDG